jgi:CubicO group peptidase (beta-lactamase class C family)
MRSLGEINQLEYLQAGLPAFGGIGSARALAKFYQILAQDGVLEGVQVLPARVLRTARAIQTSGHDQTLLLPTSFTGGFKNDPLDGGGRKQRALFGPSLTAFGQPGAGGSHAFADPESGYSFAYIMNQMEGGILPNRKSLDLVDLLYAGS